METSRQNDRLEELDARIVEVRDEYYRLCKKRKELRERLLPKKKDKNYHEQRRKEALQLALIGKSIKEIGTHFGVKDYAARSLVDNGISDEASRQAGPSNEDNWEQWWDRRDAIEANLRDKATGIRRRASDS